MKNRIKLGALLLGSALVLAGCQTYKPNWPIPEGNPDEMEIETPWVDYQVPVTSITFGKDSKTLNLTKGGEEQIEYTIQPKTATASALTWESENISIATVENGKVKAVGGGTTTVIASCGDVSARAKVNVTVPISDFSLPDTSLDLDWNETYQISPVLSPADTTQGAMTYTSNNPQAASVSASGLIETHEVDSEQSALITVHNEALNIDKNISVSVSDKYNYISSFDLSAEASEVEVGKTLQVNAAAVGIDSSKDPSTNAQVQWSLAEGDEAKAEISQEGVITAKEPGDIKVIADLAEERGTVVKHAELDLSVFEVTASGLSLGTDSHQVLELDNGDNPSHQLQWTYTLSRGGFDKPSRSGLKFVTTNANVAKVSDAGLIEVVGLGTARISAIDERHAGCEDYVDVHTTITAKSLQISKNGELYIDENLVITATTSPAEVSDPIVWSVTQEDAYATYVEDGNKITLTGAAQGSVKVKATCGSLESNEIELNITEREVNFENGKVYLVGNKNYKTGVSKATPADVGSWATAKYAYIFTDKTGNVNAKFEYKATITFAENDEWLIRENADLWRHPTEYVGEGEARHQIGEYKVNEGAFKLGQMVVTTDPEGNEKIKVKDAGKYDIYYAYYLDQNSPAEGWFSVYVEEHGMKVDKNEVHVNVGEKAYIQVSNWDEVPELTNSAETKFSASFASATSKIEITGLEVGEGTLTINDGSKDIVVTIKVKDAAPAGDPTEYYIRGTAAGGWDTDANYRLRAGTDEQYGVLLDVYLREGEFKIANSDWSKEWGWDYDNRSTIIGSAAANFCAGADSNNIHCSVEGYYDIYLMKNNYISVESEGAPIIPSFEAGYYLRGTFNGWELDNAYKMAESSDPNNHGQLIDFHLDADEEFKISDNKSDWSGYSIGWSYKNEGESEDHPVVQGGAQANFENADGNIKVKVSGDYDLYLTTNNYLYVEVHGSTPPEPPTPTKADYYVTGSFNSWAHQEEYQLDAHTGDKGEITVALESGWEFIFQSSDSSENYKYYDIVTPNDYAANFADAGGTDHNISCLVSGTYHFYLNSTGGIWIDSYEAPAEPFAIDISSANGVVGGTVVITASNYGTAITAESSNTSLATVSVSGAAVTVTLAGAGDVTITVKDDQNNPLTCTIHITAVAPVVSGVAITESSQDLAKDATLQLHATVSGSNVTQVVTWESNHPEFASVSASGLVTAVTTGVATITATSVDDPSKSASITITVPAPAVTTRTIYVNANGIFNADGAAMFVHAFESAGDDTQDVKLTQVTGQTQIYSAEIDDSFDKVLFVRQASGTEIDWGNKWNESESYTLDSSNMWTCQGYTSGVARGAWSAYDSSVTYSPLVTIYMEISTDLGTNWWDQTGYTPYAYVWQDTNTANNNAGWPGVVMTKVVDETNRRVYSFSFDPTQGFNRVIFSGQATSDSYQTDDGHAAFSAENYFKTAKVKDESGAKFISEWY